MTEFELIEVSVLVVEGFSNAGMNFVTVVFAYIAAAHFAGEKLSKTAAVSISIIYSLWLLGPLSVFLGYTELGNQTAAEYERLYPDGYAKSEQSNQIATMSLIFAPYILGWVGSLVYMHGYVRKGNKTEHRDDDT